MRGKRVTEEEYAKAKTLVAYGMDDRTIGLAIKRSLYVVKAMRESSDYRDYKAIIRTLNSQKRKPMTQQPLNIQSKTKDVAEVAKIKAQELVDELKLWRSITKNRRNALALLKDEEALMWLNYSGSDVA